MNTGFLVAIMIMQIASSALMFDLYVRERSFRRRELRELIERAKTQFQQNTDVRSRIREAFGTSDDVTKPDET